MNLVDNKIEPTASRLSFAAAIFGGLCNLLCLILENYQFYYLARYPLDWTFSLFFNEVISLAPVLVLFAMRYVSSVVFIYTFVLFFILVWRVQHLVPYNFLWAGAVSYKIDQPGLLLGFLGVISAAVLLVRAAIWFSAFIRRTQRPSGPRHDF